MLVAVVVVMVVVVVVVVVLVHRIIRNTRTLSDFTYYFKRKYISEGRQAIFRLITKCDIPDGTGSALGTFASFYCLNVLNRYLNRSADDVTSLKMNFVGYMPHLVSPVLYEHMNHPLSLITVTGSCNI